MHVHDRSTRRVPAVIGFLLLSLVAHVALLRGVNPSARFAAPQPANAVSVALIAPPPQADAAPPAEGAPARPAPRRGPRVSKPAAPVASPAPEPGQSASLDAFGSPIGSSDANDPAGAAAGQAGDPADASVRAAESGHGPIPGDAPPAVVQDAGGALAESLPAAAEPPIVVSPQAGSVRYRVHFGDPEQGNVVAILEQSFEIGADRYRLHSEGRAQGLTAWFYRGALVQDSVGTVSAGGLSPLSYREQRGSRPARTVSIDRERREATFGSGARRETPPGVQDRLSAIVQLALLRQSRPALFEPGATVVLPTLSSSRIEYVAWRVVGEEAVATDAGVVNAFRLSRASMGADDPAIDVWLALDARVVPVRMRIAEPGGRALDQVLAAE